MFKKEKYKHLIKRIPGLFALVNFLAAPRDDIARLREYLAFKRDFGSIVRVPPHSTVKPEKKLLVVSLQSNFIVALKEEALFVKSAQLAGFKPYVLTHRGAWINRYYRLFGVRNFIYLEDFIVAIRERTIRAKAMHVMSEVKTFDELMNTTYKGVHIGNYICSSLVRKTYTGGVDVNDPDVRKRVFDYLMITMMNTEAAHAIYAQYKPDAALFLERGYTPYGEFFDIALERKLNIVQWCGSHTDNAFIFKRYSAENADQHPASLSVATWQRLIATPWRAHHAERITNELFKNYASGSWFSEVGTQFNSQLMEKEKIIKMLDLNPQKKTAVIFPHLFWDATFFWGEDLFANYQEWFVEAVRAACKNTNLNWIIKVHPANSVKLYRDGYNGKLVELQTIEDRIGSLPPHVKLLYPNTEISAYSLYQCIDYCLTVRGTPGIEAAMFGVPVLTAGTGRYDRHGFTIDSVSQQEYLEKLAHIEEFLRLTAEQIERAQKFAYGTFLLRPFELHSIKISYKRDKKATQQVEYTAQSVEEFKTAPDVKSFGAWFSGSQDVDYVDWSKLDEVTPSTGHTKAQA